MSKIVIDRSVVEQALRAVGAVVRNRGVFDYGGSTTVPFFHMREMTNAMDDLRAALEQPEQEPVAWMRPDNRVAEETVTGKQFSRGPMKPPIGTWVPIYAAPTPRKPVELTDKEIKVAFSKQRGDTAVQHLIACARAVIAAYEAKNGITGGGDAST